MPKTQKGICCHLQISSLRLLSIALPHLQAGWFSSLEGVSSLALKGYKVGLDAGEEGIDGPPIDKSKKKPLDVGEYDK
jgi:hypothetical protein